MHLLNTIFSFRAETRTAGTSAAEIQISGFWVPVGWNGATSIRKSHLRTDRFIYLTIKPFSVQHVHLMRAS